MTRTPALPDHLDLRLVVTGMDGTLVDGEGRVPDRLPGVVERLERHGVLFVPASGPPAGQHPHRAGQRPYRQASTCAGSAHGDTGGVDAEILGALDDPPQHNGAVVQRRRVGVGRGKPAVDGDDEHAQVASDTGAQQVVLSGRAADAAAAVEPQQGTGG